MHLVADALNIKMYVTTILRKELFYNFNLLIASLNCGKIVSKLGIFIKDTLFLFFENML